ncbi:CopD family protein [Sphingomonas sp.]|uniref:CopD family protein n=1 Tax=Sphingomonas sp. TaxID=28214 RepID=UPI002DD6300F|nr:CopD family protein [Sphingomonas sp.]
MINLLGGAYPWVKAAHVVFVIFWMAGLFMLPRYLVYHQEGLGDRSEEARWIDREAKLRRIILTPAMAVVWVLGLLLAANAGLFDAVPGLGWLHAKLLLVVLLTGYHGWAVGYGRRLARGVATLSAKRLRAINEVPALAAILIVVLAVVRPF